MRIYSYLGSALLAFCLQLSICSAALARTLYDTPPLSLQPYEALHFPPQLGRAEVKWMLERSIEELDQSAFVDMGDMSDFMHAHVLFGREEGLELEKSLNDLNWAPPWESLEPVVALLHAQEYPGARAMRPYRNRAGKVLSPEHRNQLLWMKDTKWTKRGEVISARHFAKPDRAARHTISPADLEEQILGPRPSDLDYSFYFFRVHCPDVDALRKKGAKVEESNVLELQVGKDRACLALLNFRCRNHPEDRRYCPEGNLRPFYSPAGRIKYPR